MSGEKNYSFSNYLRGVATVLVLFSHWGVNFFSINEVCAELSYFNPIHWDKIPIVSRIAYMLQCRIGLNSGMMGVALFFLISGFLIKSSLDNRTWLKFIMTRIVRIYPVYIICLLITCVILLGSARLNGIPYRVDSFTFLANASLTRLWFWRGGIDGVVWTLEIEMFFYIIACIISYYGMAIYDKKIIAIIDFISVTFIYIIHGFYTGLATQYLYLYKTLFTIGHYLVFIPFILLGAICRLSYDGIIKKHSFYKWCGIQTFIFIVDIHYFYPGQFKEYIVSYFLMTIVFVISMNIKCKKMQLCSGIVLEGLRRIAKISFPFYALHGAAGYAVLAFLYYHFNNLLLNYIISIVLFVLLAHIIHISIERFTRKMQSLIDD